MKRTSETSRYHPLDDDVINDEEIMWSCEDGVPGDGSYEKGSMDIPKKDWRKYRHEFIVAQNFTLGIRSTRMR